MLAFAGLFSACNEDEPPLPDNLVQLESASKGFASTESSTPVKISLSRAADAATAVTVNITESGVSYGTDYTTEPAASNGTLTLTIPAGSTEASFTVLRQANVLLDGDEKLTFTIASAANPVLVGSTSQMVLSFSEILSTGMTLDINGGGSAYPNQVFIDLSANTQTAVARTSWDLGFYSGTDYRVKLNPTTGALAIALDKTDLAQVTAQDTVALVSKLTLGSFSSEALAFVDDPDGDLTKTVIAPVSATDAENKVYIVNRGTSGNGARKWQKIRVLRSGNGYTLQYADITASSFKTLTISKDAQYHFNYVSFDNGPVTVEPAAAKWDLTWTATTYKTAFGTGYIPYFYQDFVLQNTLQGVAVAQVATSTITYETFSESNVNGLTFSNALTTIGANWRRTSPSPATVYEDRFFVIKDTAGNIYKLKFTALTQNGERGKPQITYALVKKAG